MTLFAALQESGFAHRDISPREVVANGVERKSRGE
jgi:predicted ATPase